MATDEETYRESPLLPARVLIGSIAIGLLIATGMQFLVPRVTSNMSGPTLAMQSELNAGRASDLLIVNTESTMYGWPILSLRSSITRWQLGSNRSGKYEWHDVDSEDVNRIMALKPGLSTPNIRKRKWSFETLLLTIGIIGSGIAAPVVITTLLVNYRRRLSRRRMTGRCMRCGYSLIGLSEPRCPECGTPFEPPT